MNDLHCEYWLDPLCIWAFVGPDKLDRIREADAHCLDVELRIVPIFGSLEHRLKAVQDMEREGEAPTGIGERYLRALQDPARDHCAAAGRRRHGRLLSLRSR